MKKIISMVVMFVASALSIVSCANNNTTATNETSKNKENNMSTSISGKKTLVVFFSHTGENYGVGNISEGNTHGPARSSSRSAPTKAADCRALRNMSPRRVMERP